MADTCLEDLLCVEEQVVQLLLSSDISKASGPDGISVRMLKATADSISPSICKLFNQSVTSAGLEDVKHP